MKFFRTIYWEEMAIDQNGGIIIRPYRYKVGQRISYNKKPAFIERIEQQISEKVGLNMVQVFIKNEDNEVTPWVRWINPSNVKLSSDVEFVFDGEAQ